VKAIVFRAYGSPDVLRCEEIEKPAANDNEVLIRVRAAAANPLDWHVMRGSPYPLRMEGGFRAPKQPARLGFDLSGHVEAVGNRVTRFQPGDEVFGAQRGAFAEYVCASETAVASKPANLTFEQAAAVPIAGCTALQALRDKGQVQSGQTVLVNGAAGGVGTFAVQLAKSFGAHVTGVCSTRNADMIRSIGAGHVIDYTRNDFTQGPERYDLIVDLIGNHSLSAYRRVLHRRGAYVMVGGPDGPWLGPLALAFKAIVVSWFVSQKLMMILASVKTADLMVLKGLIEAGRVTPVIDRQYTLSEVPSAIRYLEEGHARGKLVIRIDRTTSAT
jgi:NADPH:quinone reductase-like Zn-dependent oxidoreductase